MSLAEHIPSDGPGGWLTPIADEFLKAYYASLPSVIREILRKDQSSDARERELRAASLTTGTPIDRQIMIDLWHPYWTMLNRFQLGFRVVGSVGNGTIDVIDPRDRASWPAPYPEAPKDPTDWVSSSNVEGFSGTIYFEPTVEGRAVPIGYFLSREDGHSWIKMGPGSIPAGPQTAYGFWMRVS